ncbi:hypothetical protein G6O69_25600 [Pseudenhygromyxa sp. WMMC2535]|uniref:hypothetical protein n=1 Tax=Pseudenhygromyxa sp. WMMC2535 TaxID=2712867 RepID=UPI001552DD9F|nr:hypothetical protein [Pseudenhygromyxa sp. WMMC2535]
MSASHSETKSVVSNEDLPCYRVDADGVPAAAEQEAQAGIARQLAEPPAWLALERGVIPAERIRKVPVGPTLLLGFGGSALGARAALEFAEVAGMRPGPVRILDAVDPAVVKDALEWATARGASVMVVSKSARTIEVLTLLEACLARDLRVSTMISDPDPGGEDTAPIRARVRAAGANTLELEIPPEVGGRWSVFTAVGQAPLRAANLDPMLLTGAAMRERDRMRATGSAELARSIAWRGAHPGPFSVLWCYSEVLMHFAAWVQQLECESLGRLREDGSRVGELVCPLRGPADQHSVAQLLLDGPQHGRVTILDFDDDESGIDAGELATLARLRIVEREATRESMTLPTRRLLVRDRGPATLGALMLHHMLETAIVAERMGIDPYGQPAVERIKRGIRARLG